MMYYKVVQVKPSGLFSFIGEIFNEYEKGKWTERRPDCGPMAVFTSLHDAKYFLINCRDSRKMYAIYLCEIVVSMTNIIYWRLGHGTAMSARDISSLPAGTELADKVKLVKRIW